MKPLEQHPATAQQLTVFRQHPVHGLLLLGPSGVGKRSLAEQLVEQVLDLPPATLGNYPHKMVLGSEPGVTIGIEAVRDIEHFLSLQVPGQAPYRRAIIIDGAQALTTEAQNALLKTLEEPPADTLVVLTAPSPEALLPTIVSRLQTIQVLPPATEQLKSYFQAQGSTDNSIGRAVAMSGGLPGLMQALLADDDHPLVEAAQLARELLAAHTYERLLKVDSLAKQRQLADNTIFILQQMAHLSLQKASGAAAERWRQVLQAAYEAEGALVQSAQPKLVLTKLLMQF